MPHIPFTQNDLHKYGAWLLPDGDYVIFGTESGHASTALKISVANNWIDAEQNKRYSELSDDYVYMLVPSKNIEAAYTAMFTNGCARIKFDMQEVYFETLILNAQLISDAMSVLAQVPIYVEVIRSARSRVGTTVPYENVGDFRAKNGLMVSVTEKIRSGLELSPELKTQPLAEPTFSLAWVRKFCKFARSK